MFDYSGEYCDREPFDDDQWEQDLCSEGLELPPSKAELKEKYWEQFRFFDADGVEQDMDENDPLHWEMIDRAWERAYSLEREEISKRDQAREDWQSHQYWLRESNMYY